MAFPSAVPTFGVNGFHKVSNLSEALLSADITSTDTTVSISSADEETTWPTSNFVILIDSELLFIDSRSGTNLTVNGSGRAFGGTTAEAHEQNTLVKVVLAWENIDAMQDEIIALADALLGNVAWNLLIDGNITSSSGDIHAAGDLIADTNLSVAGTGSLGGKLTVTAGGSDITGDVLVNGDVTADAFIGDGSGLTGIGTGTGGIINTGSTTIGADSDVDGTGVIDLQTRTISRLRIENNGDINTQGNIITGVGDPVDADDAVNLDQIRLLRHQSDETTDFTAAAQTIHFVQNGTAATQTVATLPDTPAEGDEFLIIMDANTGGLKVAESATGQHPITVNGVSTDGDGAGFVETTDNELNTTIQLRFNGTYWDGIRGTGEFVTENLDTLPFGGTGSKFVGSLLLGGM